MKIQSRTELYRHQDGLVAIVVTIALMLVISLIVLGFSQTVRREQRQALDNHLSTQAFYAAESGINLARENLASFLAPPGKTDCLGSGLNYNIAPGVDITCLLIDATPDDLQYSLSPLTSDVGLLETTSAMNEMVINWQAGSGSGSGSAPAVSAGCTGLTNKTVSVWADDTPPINANSCSQPLLRVDLVRLDGTTANDWSNNQFTAFLYPEITSGTTTIGFADANNATNRGKKFQVTCNNILTAPGKTSACKVAITGLTGTKYGFRLMSVYRDASVSVSANNGGTTLTLINGQAVIDSTARAQDVLHRIQARVQLTGGLTPGSQTNGFVPDFGIYSKDGLCKQYVYRSTRTTWSPPTPALPPTTVYDVYTTQNECKPGAGW